MTLKIRVIATKNIDDNAVKIAVGIAAKQWV